ncbi:MAG: hypothetical protein WCX83_00795 [Candidatus Cloacimonas sp.]|nr:hypothetical protein [Candidatus Cloacimonadota bacterium]
MFRLADEHLQVAIEIIERNRHKKRCNNCYDRGYIGYTLENQVIPCHKCVNEEEAMQEWKEYVATVPELKEYYSDMFEEEEKADENS